MFFIISGYLITKSYDQSDSPRTYFLKRVFRILPALLICAATTSFIAIVVTSHGIPTIGLLRDFMHYTAETTMLADTAGESFADIRFVENDYGAVFNGSLWSLRSEFLCYIAVMVLGVSGMLTKRTAWIALGMCVVTHIFYMMGSLGWVAGFFAAGAVLYLSGHWFMRWPVLAISAMGLIGGAALGYPTLAFMLFGSVLTIAAGLSRFQLPSVTRWGDLSYGIYLYGWPVQGTVAMIMQDQARPWSVFLIAVAIAAPIAFLSWHLVEKPSLRLAGSHKFRANPAAVAQ